MSVFRIYPIKGNTIASGAFSNYNSSQNAVTDLFYGGGVQTSVRLRNAFSRHLMYFDLTELNSKIATGEIMSGSVSSYRLRMTNSIPAERILEKNWEFDKLQRKISASFDLQVFPANKSWDEGRGYDLVQEDYLVKQKGNLLVTGYSNWNSATSTVDWDEPGVYTNPSASTTNYAEQHFAIGNEDLNMDITDIVTDWLSGGSTNYGLLLGYRRDYELLSSDTRSIASFFTHKTNTAFKPYLEVVYDQTIKDDRNQVTNNRPARLFLYTFSGNTPANYASASTVNILNSAGSAVHSGLVPTQLEKGVYYVDVFMSGTTRGEQYRDVWQGVSFNTTYDTQDITQYFSIQDNFYTGTQFQPAINDYVLDMYGLPEGGIVHIGQQIRVYCNLRAAYSTQPPKNNYNLKYRLYMNNQKETIGWTEVNQAVINKKKLNFFTLDTSWLLHNQTYQIQFQIEEWGTTRMYPKTLDFKILRPF
ncbi:MAG: hypothetical protein P8J32_01130 [bacterium]|nr:hypothetical protein [bacterium]